MCPKCTAHWAIPKESFTFYRIRCYGGVTYLVMVWYGLLTTMWMGICTIRLDLSSNVIEVVKYPFLWFQTPKDLCIRLWINISQIFQGFAEKVKRGISIHLEICKKLLTKNGYNIINNEVIVKCLKQSCHHPNCIRSSKRLF